MVNARTNWMSTHILMHISIAAARIITPTFSKRCHFYYQSRKVSKLENTLYLFNSKLFIYNYSKLLCQNYVKIINI